ncbi:MAG: hypothetical protein C5B56_13260 [Proteobacteria bacterium]|nr:MAG: hypothetical protein C5B56_13260 [Pseudomonadota bacterium]
MNDRLDAREQKLSEGLRALAAESRAGAPARVERRLVAAFRREMGAASVPRRAGWVPMVAWSTAVAATLLAGFVLLEGRQPQRTHHVVGDTVELAAVDPAEAADPMAALADGDGEFIPLPNAEGIAPNEQVNLVRVEVPRSSMIPLGYAVSEENAAEVVEADVVLGADGVARAIRFRSESSDF